VNDGHAQRGELQQQLASLEKAIQLAKGNEEFCQKEVKGFEESLQSLSVQQDEGTMGCSERIFYSIAGKFLTW